MRLTRRHFLASGTAAVATLSACHRLDSPAVPGHILNEDEGLGHRIRDGSLPAPRKRAETDILIIGAGISGLAAARQLQRQGVDRIRVVELSKSPGGNSASGSNQTTAFPWGAHYIPLPTAESPEMRELFQELGVITGFDTAQRPIYSEEYLVHDPMERLFHYGAWREGIVPQFALEPSERDAIHKFLHTVNELKATRGRDGKRVFTIPLSRSSTDPAWRQLDTITFHEWLHAHGFTGPSLLWYLNYCCRDDFGAGIRQVSAWAGLHYFAARNGEASNAPSHTVVTWPAGNGWIVNKFVQELGPRLQCGAAAYQLGVEGPGITVDVFQADTQQSTRFAAKEVLLATPSHVARRLLNPFLERGARPNPAATRVHTPWLVANLALKSMPDPQDPSPAWDNVLFDSPGLGYVTATHQQLRGHTGATVLTYYRPLDELSPTEERLRAQKRTHAEWCDSILADLSTAHPQLRRLVQSIDIKIWGHAMALPVPGFLEGLDQPPFLGLPPNIHFAHCDQTGMSLFDEAYIRGIDAAKRMGKRLKDIG